MGAVWSGEDDRASPRRGLAEASRRRGLFPLWRCLTPWDSRAAVSRRSCVREEGRTFLNKVFGGDATSLIVHFAKDARIPPEDIERLKRMLDEKTVEDEP